MTDPETQELNPDEPWAVEDLTPEELAGLQATLDSAAGPGCCQDGEEAGLGDDDHGLGEVI
jgi:hypothetical protein